jgi:hypothetical protein
MTEEHKIDSEQALAEYIDELRKAWWRDKYLLVKYRTGKTRTLTQNAALHLWCDMLAERLNDAGLDVRTLIKPDIEIPWSGIAVKHHIFKPVLEAMTTKTSTTEADRWDDYNGVIDVITKHLGQKHGVQAPEWPRKKDDQG